MKIKVYLNNEDGTFERLNSFDGMEFDAYNRPYYGYGVQGVEGDFIIYNIEIKNDIMECFVCKPHSDLLKGLQIFKVEVLGNSELSNIAISSEKYLEGKKCKMPDGSIITMGKILEKVNCIDQSYNNGVGNPTCII